MADNSKEEIKSSEGARVFLDPYLEWAGRQEIPIHLDFGHDLLALKTERNGPL